MYFNKTESSLKHLFLYFIVFALRPMYFSIIYNEIGLIKCFNKNSFLSNSYFSIFFKILQKIYATYSLLVFFIFNKICSGTVRFILP